MKEIVDIIKIDFERNKDAQNAIKMEAYMKNRFSFLGIKSPLRNEISKPFLKHKFDDQAQLKLVVEELWLADYREYQYLAMEMLHRNRKLLTLDSLPFLTRLVTTKSWWDTVDNLAAKVLGLLLLRFPDELESNIQPWIESDNLWLNRTAIIFQLKYKDKIRLDLLTEAIEAHMDSKEFFHAKAIGWALRQHSKIDKVWVGRFINTHTLRPLSVREGSKYL